MQFDNMKLWVVCCLKWLSLSIDNISVKRLKLSKKKFACLKSIIPYFDFSFIFYKNVSIATLWNCYQYLDGPLLEIEGQRIILLPYHTPKVVEDLKRPGPRGLEKT